MAIVPFYKLFLAVKAFFNNYFPRSFICTSLRAIFDAISYPVRMGLKIFLTKNTLSGNHFSLLKFGAYFIAFSMFCQPLSYCADQWVKELAGTTAVSDVDAYITQNNESLDRLEFLARWKGRIISNSSSPNDQLTAEAGAIAIPDSAGTVVRWRRNTASTTITWSDIDTGAEANSTTYYIYATADVDETTYRFKISASSTAPSGITYYRKIASFFNDSSGNITKISDDDFSFSVDSWINFKGTGTISINDSGNVSSITDTGSGEYTITWTTSFANANYAVVGMVGNNATGNHGFVRLAEVASPIATGSVRVDVLRNDGSTQIDVANVMVIAVGRRSA